MFDWRPAGDICYKRDYHAMSFFDALRQCRSMIEYKADIKQEYKEDWSNLLTLGKLYQFFKDEKSILKHFKHDIRLNAIKYNGVWYEITKVPKTSYIDLATIESSGIGQQIPKSDIEPFGFNYEWGGDRYGLVFNPRKTELKVSYHSHKHSWLCSHKREKKVGEACPGEVSECNDRGTCYDGICLCRKGYPPPYCTFVKYGEGPNEPTPPPPPPPEISSRLKWSVLTFLII